MRLFGDLDFYGSLRVRNVDTNLESPTDIEILLFMQSFLQFYKYPALYNTHIAAQAITSYARYV